ncbi:MAG: IclR family transcriptional regulator C-terminal domain-containing protein, partial [Polaromonas sp.]
PIRNQLIKAGDRWPLGVGGGACALLAALSDEEVDDVLARNAQLRAARFPRCTDGVIRQLIRETRAKGYCLQPGLVIESSWAVGVPVYSAQGRPVASISIAAIETRLGLARSVALGNRLMQASAELTQLQAAAEEGAQKSGLLQPSAVMLKSPR